MWRSNTDVLQTWTRVMIEVESMANQGHISRPGAWSFPDCLEVGFWVHNNKTTQKSPENVTFLKLREEAKAKANLLNRCLDVMSLARADILC